MRDPFFRFKTSHPRGHGDLISQRPSNKVTNPSKAAISEERAGHTAHGYQRFLAFCDAVVAIAITLLILPLVDAVNDLGTLTAGQFALEHLHSIFVFLLSFAVIGNFWIVHHRLYERVTGYSTPLIWANLLWLASIVFLPFPTQLLGSSDRTDITTTYLYIGTMLITCASMVIQQLLIGHRPEIQVKNSGRTFAPTASVIMTLLVLVALVIAVTMPTIGLWSLVITAAETPITALTRRRQLRT